VPLGSVVALPLSNLLLLLVKLLGVEAQGPD
jgi:hypothetical protein